MNFFKKQRAFASLDHASKNLLEILLEGTKLDEDEQSYIECHLRLMQMTYSNWKNGPMDQNPRSAADHDPTKPFSQEAPH